MSVIKDKKGNLVQGSDKVLEVQKDFYKNLYTKDPLIGFNMINNTEKKLDSTLLTLMESELTLEELTQAIKEMPRKKCPGYDGLMAGVYKMFWNKLKQLLLNCYLYAKRNSCLHPTARIGILSLIPKKDKCRKKVANWRPISLLNTNFKILSKAIANRLKLTFTDLIDEDQTGFIRGKLISQNIRTMLDVMQYTWLKRIPTLVVSVDFQKAFDRVDYGSLYKILAFFGFGDKFIGWIKLLFSHMNLSVTNDGYCSEYWSPTCGLFQGNPVAPFLFLFLTEILAIKLKENPKVEGIEMKGIRFLLSQFADDMDLFIKAKETVWQEVMSIFDFYEAQTGMKISYQKTTIYRIGSLRDSQEKFTSARKVRWVNEPLNILGIYVSHDEHEYLHLNYSPLLEKAGRILDIWRMRDLSIMGKVQIVNSLIVSLFNYRFTVLPSPGKKFLEKMKQIITQFIWDGKRPKISYKTLTGLKEQGGMGLVDLEARDKALKVQWPFYSRGPLN